MTAVGLLVTGVSQTISLVRRDLKPVNVLSIDCPFVLLLLCIVSIALMNRSHRRLTLML